MDSTTANIQSRESSTAFDAPTYEISYGADHTLQWDPPQGSKELAIALSYHFPLEKDLESKMREATKNFLKAEAKRKKTLPGWNTTVSKAKDVLMRATRTISPEKEIPATIPASRTQMMLLNSAKVGQQAGRKDPIITTRSIGEEPSSAPGTHENEQPLFSDISSGIRPIKPSGSASPPRSSSSGTLQILKWDPGVNRFVKRKKRRYGKEEGSKVAANRGNACVDHQRKKMKCNPELCPQNKQNLRNDYAPHQHMTVRASKLEKGGNFQELMTMGTIFPSSSSAMPHETTADSSGTEGFLDDGSDLQPTNCHDSKDDGTKNVISLQATIIPDDPSLPEFWTDSWDHDSSFFSLPLSHEQDTFHQFGNSENPSTQKVRLPLSESESALDCVPISQEDRNIGSKPNLDDDRTLSGVQQDQQDTSHLRDTIQTGLRDFHYNQNPIPDDINALLTHLPQQNERNVDPPSNVTLSTFEPTFFQYLMDSSFIEREGKASTYRQTLLYPSYSDTYEMLAPTWDGSEVETPVHSSSIKDGLDETSPGSKTAKSEIPATKSTMQDQNSRIELDVTREGNQDHSEFCAHNIYPHLYRPEEELGDFFCYDDDDYDSFCHYEYNAEVSELERAFSSHKIS